MDGKAFRELVSGTRHGLFAGVLRFLLRTASLPYSAVVRCRNLLYDHGVFPTTGLGVPTISVGNLTLGGTGKTPLVAWIAERLCESGFRPGLISRGYGLPPQVALCSDQGVPETFDDYAPWATLNDEGRELALRLPEIPHLQDADRIAAGRRLLEQYAVDALVLDDAFQHRRIARDLDIVLVDATEPFGFERIFPAGTLREPLTALRRADVVLLSRADRLEAEKRVRLRDRVLRLAPHVLWAEVVHRPETLVDLTVRRDDPGQLNRGTIGLETLQDKAVAAFCGIGNPDGFRHTLENCGARVVLLRSFADHHRYTRRELEDVAAEARGAGAEMLLCTMKDLVKITVRELNGLPLHALRIGIDFLDGEDALKERLRQLQPQKHQ